MKKTINVSSVGFDTYGGYAWLYNRFLLPLTNKYNFVRNDQNPDFLFCTILDTNFDFIKYNCPRIFICEENIQPIFQLYDYWIGYDNKLSYGDRFLYLLLCLFNIKTISESLEIPTSSCLKDHARSRFCDFIYSHDDNGIRTKYFNLLNNYKKVYSYGTFKHGDGDEIAGGWPYKNKVLLQKKSKFSLIIESSKFSGGLVTEKIFHSLLAGSIPIYLGENEVNSIINPKRFINIKSFRNDEELLNYIKEVDNNDKLYNSIVTQPPLIDPLFFKKQYNNMILFLDRIFSQEQINAVRRPDDEGLSKMFNDLFRKYNKNRHSKLRLFKKILR